MPLTSTITPYDPRWPKQHLDEAARLGPVFGAAMREIHHVGSTAVPGLAAKPEIDLLVVVENISGVDSWTQDLAAHRYQRGGDLSAGHLFYKRDVDGSRTHKIHVCLAGHPNISEMLSFRDYLRCHDEVRDEYQALKIALEQDNSTGIVEYLQGKEPFIRAVLNKIAAG